MQNGRARDKGFSYALVRKLFPTNLHLDLANNPHLISRQSAVAQISNELAPQGLKG